MDVRLTILIIVNILSIIMSLVAIYRTKNTIDSDIHYIENQILRHLVYHFDDNDLSKITNLPFDYWEYIEPFERLVACLYEGDGEE